MQRPREPKQINRKIEKEKQRDHINLLLLIILAAVLIGGVYYACTADQFRVLTVQIKGNDRLDSHEIARKSGVKYGENVFLLSKRNIRERLMTDPFIDEVTVKKRPPGSVLLEIQERLVIGYVQSGGKAYLLDKEGMIIEGSENYKARRTDAKINLDRVDPENQGPLLTKEQINFVLHAVESPYSERIRSYDLNNPEYPMITLEDNTKVFFNTTQDLDYQFQFLEEIFKKTAEEGKKLKKVTFREESDPVVETE